MANSGIEDCTTIPTTTTTIITFTEDNTTITTTITTSITTTTITVTTTNTNLGVIKCWQKTNVILTFLDYSFR